MLITPTRAPRSAMLNAVAAARVDLPTPPFPAVRMIRVIAASVESLDFDFEQTGEVVRVTREEAIAGPLDQLQDFQKITEALTVKSHPRVAVRALRLAQELAQGAHGRIELPALALPDQGLEQLPDVRLRLEILA